MKAVVDKAKELADEIGALYLYLFAADQDVSRKTNGCILNEINDAESPYFKLMKYYKSQLRFIPSIEAVDPFHINKPEYDY